jgi:pyruvate/2-oxoglutarate dehydrogenase complex dihydrolipoamide dehydrogenase (E3) component
MNRRFDAIIIGTGQAGSPLAARLTAVGMSVAVVERKLFGGTCVNTGCTPTKTLVANARTAYVARRAADFGVMIEGKIGIDFAKVQARAATVAGTSRSNIEKWLARMERCTVLRGQARFESPHAVRVGDDVLVAERIFINVGGRARIPDFGGARDIKYLTNSSMLALKELPEHLVVVGGSYVGLEFAQMYRRFGSEVTVVERMPRLIAREDEDVSSGVQDILAREKIAFRLESECISFTPQGKDVTVHVDCKVGDRKVTGTHVLLAVGRQPNTDDLALDRAGVAVDPHGYIVVDDQLRTSVPGIWAIGDCNGRGAFTHTSYNDFEIVAANLLDNDPRRVSDRIYAAALYIDPPLGRAGLTETAARALGRPLLIGTRPMTRVSRATERDETLGFIKVIVDRDTKRILGASILGIEGDEAIHGILDIMYAGAPYTTLQRSVGIHPTVSELLPTVLGELRPVEPTVSSK